MLPNRLRISNFNAALGAAGRSVVSLAKSNCPVSANRTSLFVTLSGFVHIDNSHVVGSKYGP